MQILHFSSDEANVSLCKVVSNNNGNSLTNSIRKLKEITCIDCIKIINEETNNIILNGITLKEELPKITQIIDGEVKKVASNVGKILTHCDGQANHICVVLDENEDDAFILLLTSNPKWNKYCRILTNEELNFFSFSKATYFAPVIRSKADLSFTKVGYLPEHRVEELKNEFYNLPYTDA